MPQPSKEPDYIRAYYKTNRVHILAQKKERYTMHRISLLAKEKERWEDHPENKLLILAKQRAKRLNLDFNLCVNDINIPEICPVLGIPLRRGDKKISDSSPTLDRIIPSKGYIKGNVVVMSWRANKLKGNASPEEINKLAKWINEWQLP